MRNGKTTEILSSLLWDSHKILWGIFVRAVSFDFWVLSLPASVCLCVNPELFWVITCHPFKPGSPNLVQNTLVKTPIVLGVIDLTFKVKFNLKIKISLCLVSPPEKIYLPLEKIHYRHDYLDWFTVPALSQSPSPAHTYVPRPLHDPGWFTVSTFCTCTDLGSQGYFRI